MSRSHASRASRRSKAQAGYREQSRQPLPILVFLLPVCIASCISWMPASSGFHSGLASAVRMQLLVRVSPLLTARSLCDRTADDLLALAGSVFTFDQSFPCLRDAKGDLHRIVGFTWRDGDVVHEVSDDASEDLNGLCDELKLSLWYAQVGDPWEFTVYFQPLDERDLVRMRTKAYMMSDQSVAILIADVARVAAEEINWVADSPDSEN